jgi:hypothetical protein
LPLFCIGCVSELREYAANCERMQLRLPCVDMAWYHFRMLHSEPVLASLTLLRVHAVQCAWPCVEMAMWASALKQAYSCENRHHSLFELLFKVADMALDGPLAPGGLGGGKFLALLLQGACVRLSVFSDAGAFASETPMDGATKFVNFLAEVPWEDASPEMMEQVKALLKYNLVTRVSHFAHLDVKKIRSDLAGPVPGGAIYGMRMCIFGNCIVACVCMWQASSKQPSSFSIVSMGAMTNQIEWLHHVRPKTMALMGATKASTMGSHALSKLS